MHTRTVEQVRTWDSRPFSGGLGTLYELAETDHTGAVVAEDTWLFMLNGRVIGIFEGTMDDFEASGTIYTTPHDSLPLLFAMQEREGRTRAKYFTEDTPLAEADRTLADANFTGYIELSENVLSGDYYLVYYGGTRRSVAFIGQSERVETGDAAFEKAADEVGIYEVLDVSMTITEIPEPRAETTGAAVVEAEDGADADTAPESEAEPDQESERAAASTPGSTDDGPETESTDAQPADPDDSEAEAVETAADDPGETATAGSEDSDSVTASSADATAEAGATTPDGDPREMSGTEPTRERTPTAEQSSTEHGDRSETVPPGEGTDSQSTGAEGGESAQPDDRDSELERMFRAEEQWRRSNAIPALDPDETEPTDAEQDGTGAAGTGATETAHDRSARSTRSESATGTKTESGRASSTVESRSTPDRVPTAGDRQTGKPPSTAREQVEAELEKREARIEDLQNRVATIEQERSELAEELEDEQAKRSSLETELSELRAEREELQSRVDELEAALAGEGPAADPETTAMSPREALAGTNLFVRYESKSDPTLEALGPEADPDAVNANLTLEHHTQFDTADVQVDGLQYREFLEGTGEFRFVSWVLRELPYELLETGNRNALGDLFEAISAIDRVEFDGSVSVDPESGTERQFALVMRDRMGNPLVLGEYNDDRNPVRDAELETLLDGAREVASSTDSLAGAFYVTASFFEPDALERAENAASSGGLFSRQEKASFVTPDSGTGFHLGLVEDRSQAFHVTVPKL